MAMNRTHGTLVFTTKQSVFHGCSDPQMPDGTIIFFLPNTTSGSTPKHGGGSTHFCPQSLSRI